MKKLAKWLLLALMLVCATILSAITRNGEYFGCTLLAVCALSFFALIADSE